MQSRHRYAGLALAVALASSLACPADAARVGIELTGGYGQTAIGDLNRFVSELEQRYGVDFGDVGGGGGLGVAVRSWPSERWLFRLGYEWYSLASANTSMWNDVSFYPFAHFVTLDVTRVTGGPGRFHAGLGAGGGVAILEGDYEVEGSVASTGMRGTGPEAHIALLADLRLFRRLGLTAQTGYRFSRIADTRFGGTSPSPTVTTDLSGPFLRIGLAY